MVPRENKNNAYAKFWRTNKEYYGIFEGGPIVPQIRPFCHLVVTFRLPSTTYKNLTQIGLEHFWKFCKGVKKAKWQRK